MSLFFLRSLFGIGVMGVCAADDAAVGPEQEDAVDEGEGTAYDGAGDGGCVPDIGAGGEEVVGDCDEAEGG